MTFTRMPSRTIGYCVALLFFTAACSGCASTSTKSVPSSTRALVPQATTTTVVPATIASTSIASTTTVSTTTIAAVVTTAAPTTTAVVARSPITTARPAALFGAAIGAEAEGAIAKLTGVLGAPDVDTGWDVGCPLNSATVKDERQLTWGHLHAYFTRPSETAAGAFSGYGYVLLEGEELPLGDAIRRITLPNGVSLGAAIGDVAKAIGAKVVANPTFGWMSVATSGVEFTADGKANTSPLNAVSVPHVFTCE